MLNATRKSWGGGGKVHTRPTRFRVLYLIFKNVQSFCCPSVACLSVKMSGVVAAARVVRRCKISTTGKGIANVGLLSGWLFLLGALSPA